MPRAASVLFINIITLVLQMRTLGQKYVAPLNLYQQLQSDSDFPFHLRYPCVCRDHVLTYIQHAHTYTRDSILQK